MKILVTGGCGFIGTNVVEKLVERHRVKIIDSSPPKINADFVNADIRSREEISEATKGFDAVIHLAAKSDARNMQDFLLFKEINIDGTLNVMEAARKNDIKNVIFASSSHVYGDKKEKSFKESDPIKPVSHYGATKFLGETICRAYSEFYGINCTVLRLFTVYGPRGRKDMAVMKFIQSIDKGEPIHIHGNGRIKKDFVYIDDVSEAIIKSISAKRKFEIINVGSGKATELNELAALIQSALGKKAEKKFVPMQVGDTMYSCAEISKAKKLLKWQPKVSIKEGIKKTVAWWKGNKKL